MADPHISIQRAGAEVQLSIEGDGTPFEFLVQFSGATAKELLLQLAWALAEEMRLAQHLLEGGVTASFRREPKPDGGDLAKLPGYLLVAGLLPLGAREATDGR